uniref:Uncharacterized protein n=1 Tax=Acrobeloides nanus TaxID=290746 RepID=A0A914ERH2_9BILA
MNVTFSEPPTNGGGVLPHARSRHYIEQLKKFIQLAENPNSTATTTGVGLSDIGFLLLRLKDQLLTVDPRSNTFASDFASKQHNGLILLIKVVIVLQGIVNSVNNKSRFSSLLNRKNSATNVRRKASVSEADCMECVKLVLEKSPHAWGTLLENSYNLEVIINSINSPQLDSKCYALEIILALLEQPRGFDYLFRTLTHITAKSGDYLRLALIVGQLKHGLHTSKLHIQILVARLMNKLLMRAPTPNHRLLAQAEATLAQYSSEHVEKLLMTVHGPLGGIDTLMDELSLWKDLYNPNYLPPLNNSTRSADSVNPRYNGGGPLYDPSPDASQSSRTRKVRTTFKTPPVAQTSLMKNVERQRMRRQGELNGVEGKHPYYTNDRSLTMTKSLDPNEAANYLSHMRIPRSTEIHDYRTLENGRMRRVKSESAVGFDEFENDDRYNSTNRGLKRFGDSNEDYGDYNAQRPFNTKLSRSIHDLSHVPPSPIPMEPRSVEAPPNFYTTNGTNGAVARTESGRLSPNYSLRDTTMNRMAKRTMSPVYQTTTSPIPPVIPPYDGPPQGFNNTHNHSPAYNINQYNHNHDYPYQTQYDDFPSNGYKVSPMPMSPIKTNNHGRASPTMATKYSNDANHVVYIPINMVEGNNGVPPTRSTSLNNQQQQRFEKTDQRSNSLYDRYDRRKQTLEDLSNMNQNGVSYNTNGNGHINGNGHTNNNLGADVQDALSQFDYLNDYDAASVRSGPTSRNGPTAIYHF